MINTAPLYVVRSPFAEGSRGTFLVTVFTLVMSRGVWELQPRHLSPEPPLCFQLQAQLLRSYLRTIPCQTQGTVEKDLFPPVLPRTQPLETPRFSTSSSLGSSPTFIPVSK
ncbi:hypothetical protein ATANTOWER_021743 [Ataeniobius toweri]|uniref:Uncharacterized protein n=1 Tax=Ataeniobius toweri TaxID=208326 RepID=A0ABU7CI17_9TELE|nr:hypothetical protein [Ataeniobius toweri]